MKRDLVFFIAGLSFGIAAGYFAFRALAPGEGAQPAAAAVSAPASPIGLESEAETAVLDEDRLDALRAEAEASPEDASVRERIGRLYLEAGRFDDALEWIDQAVALSPREPDLLNAKALAHLNLGQLDATVAAYEAALAAEPSHPGSLLGLGRVRLYLQQDIDGGLALWKKLVAVAPGSEEARSVQDELDALQSAHPGS